ncbi:lytic transglycosylase domain-containing protein [Defluviimonas sp. WL0075]|uniref:Lytic transglycosylase domain-containing protein n=1 Tax=Albidovulum sediminicola TaxID=2984331 RepID=A0ABT2YZE7_9RHOB|nr:lytic transglycosylase domain-containing protein [Defluviimonas sp. WL0075]MCV2864142.1 lytic transglycosylase domain-containing protein [Defluviimonas sp. WL0075]
MIRRLALAASMTLALTTPLRADDPAAMALALRSAASGDWSAAMGQAARSGPLAEAVIDWQRLRDGEGAFSDYVTFLARYPDWPGLPLLRKKGESVAAGQDPASVRAYFKALAPQTGEGSLAYAAALEAQGAQGAARDEVVRAWRSISLTAEDHAAFLARYGAVLADHHDGRTAAMLRAGLTADARRMLPLASPYTRAVAEARIALQDDDKGVDGLIGALPEKAVNSGGLAYDRFRWRIRRDLYDSADELLLERSGSAAALGDPDQWADWRRKLARKEMREGDQARAYRMAAGHHLTSGEDFADLEWLAGYIALRKLGKAEAALSHFNRFEAAVSSPISLARANYWEGRALEAIGRRAEAQAAFAEGARYQTAFYGLLSAEKVGLPLPQAMAGGETYPGWRGAPFTGSTVFQAAQLLQAAGERTLALRFLLHLSEGLSGQDIARLAGLALEWRDANTALLLAKAAADRGVILPSAYFPTNGIERLKLPIPPELALSIARRESEFDPSAVSHVGARGLMQVMPATAKKVAGQIGVGYDLAKLSTDWEYNAQIGSAYLAGLVEEFGTSPVLVAAGYNAGPGRPRQWIGAFGDPRSDGVDVVDWIEAIPFRETQNYVMRVAESLPIYRMRLGLGPDGKSFTDLLKGR